MDPIPKNPRKRAKHTRSRLGCRVCRIRRIRCDNTHPTCLKCSSTGRKCEWYLGDSTSLCIIQRSPSNALSDDALENRFLDFFRQNTLYHLSGSCEIDFWTRIVLQVSEREPCVRYGLVALGSLHEAFQDEHFSDSRLFPHETQFGQYAWMYYIRAIELLNTHILVEGWNGVEVALLCCILCVGFEWLRGCYGVAEGHLQSGLTILNQWLEGKGPESGYVSYSSARADFMLSQIAPVFSRLALRARTFIATPVPCTALLVSEHRFPPVPALKDARDELYGILGQSCMNGTSYRSSTYPTWSATKETKQSQLLNLLSEWYDTRSMVFSSTNPDSVSLLISYTMIVIMVGTSLSTDQMQFDRYEDQFGLIVHLADILSSLNNSHSASVPIELVPILYYVALKCRHPLARRRAVSLISACGRRESPWDSDATARIVREVIAIEEEGVALVVEPSDVMPFARVNRLWVWTNLDNRKSDLKCRRQGDQHWTESRVVTW
ncbi:hypothetical protein CC80DRAFT_537881 [Byssothecium circinans]|uniref:Zn(2)-C6 fungal-type domain-containing protein n=1 Tax=Byssothecium circinans TaxID=147558 RepID=A0A6A5TJD3_9PLEO|nr:hypothetical protein CC80DRAFT_537881 [Byssothecium circinans]